MTFTAHKLDILTNDQYICLLNKADADKYGIVAGDSLYITTQTHKTGITLFVDITNNLVERGVIGLFNDVWLNHRFHEGETVEAQISHDGKSAKIISEKLQGKKLDKHEIEEVINDIAKGEINPVLTSAWVCAGFAPGFDEREIYDMTLAIANSGDKLSWNGKIAVDKHSIGGVGGKAITPIVVSILANIPGIIVPNTSSRAITTASATTDMLESIMNMSFSLDELYKFIENENAFMVWGGGIDLAPADDKIIKVQKLIGIESNDKVISSIIAKKIAQGITHMVLDIPYGKYAKVKTKSEAIEFSHAFRKLASDFGIQVVDHIRQVFGIDGNALGPNLEIREVLRVFEGDLDASRDIISDSLLMAAKVVDLVGIVPTGSSIDFVKDILTSEKAESKFRDIVKMQGGNFDISSKKMKLGHIQVDITADKSGDIAYIVSRKAFEICKALGNPHVKEAGIYFWKKTGETVKVGDTLMTLYAKNESRMNLALKVLGKNDPFEIV
ncbi:hypothetical protein IPJ91_00780 [bacterium]|nr:MAG: hypothetical protein IPJ91_00780 [bacterium]